MIKHVLIVDNSPLRLSPILESAGQIPGKPKDYRMSGIFTQFNEKNRNDRIYTAEKFLPHLNELLERKKLLTVVYGEWDHPEVFDTSLQRISHTIENVTYNQQSNRVDGEIRLLNTRWGKEAKALVDDGCPIFVSSRAAGITESDGTVSVKKLFTYDCVADPGFGSARMSLNESLGYNWNDKSTNFRIYDVSDESKINELFKMNDNKDFVTKNQMVEYSEYLTEEIIKMKDFLHENVKGGKVDNTEILKMSEIYENLQAQQMKVNDYLNYLAETIQVVVNENKDLKTTTDKLKKHNDYLATELEKTIDFSDKLAENLEKNIDYSKYIAETLDKSIDFQEYIAENTKKTIDFSDYLAENLEKNIDYSTYIAEHLDKNIAYAEYLCENLEKNIDYSQYIAENLDKNIAYSEYLSENLDKNIDYSQYLAEHVDNNVDYIQYVAEHVDNNISYVEYVAEHASDSQAYMKYIAENLDNTIQNLKASKLFESEDSAQFGMQEIDIKKYYDDDDDFAKDKDEEDNELGQPVQRQPVQGQPVQGQPVQEPVQGQPVQGQPVQGQPIQGQPVQGQPVQGQPVQGQPVQGQPVQGQPVQGQPVQAPIDQTQPGSVEGEPIEGSEIVPGATVTFQVNGIDKTGEIVMTTPGSDMVLVKLSDTEEELELHESKITVIGDKIMETEKSLKNYMSNLINEVKKRKASEVQEPYFVQFLTEKNKKSWYGLTPEDKEKVIFTINESGDQIYSEGQLLYTIQESLTVKKSFQETLLENMPSELIPIWNKIDENKKASIISSANLYPNLNSSAKMEKFWESRGLETYTLIKENKQTLNENRVIDNVSLSNEEIDRFISKIKNLG